MSVELIEKALIQGDLSKLTPEDRLTYYHKVCESVGLNPLTRPFEYITLNGKLTLYARKDATDQLRRQNSVSIEKPDIRFEDDWIVVTVVARDANGRTDSDLGVVNRKDMRGDFGNALMKAVTKAKRRVTLSICGLGFLDETEVETIPDAKPEVHQPVALPAPPPKKLEPPAELLLGGMTRQQHDEMLAAYKALGGDPGQLATNYEVATTEEIPVAKLAGIMKTIRKRQAENVVATKVG